jgi:hypothetical protein
MTVYHITGNELTHLSDMIAAIQYNLNEMNDTKNSKKYRREQLGKTEQLIISADMIINDVFREG